MINNIELKLYKIKNKTTCSSQLVQLVKSLECKQEIWGSNPVYIDREGIELPLDYEKKN